MEIHENVLSSNNACIKNQLGIMWFKCAMLFIHFFHKRNDKYYGLISDLVIFLSTVPE